MAEYYVIKNKNTGLYFRGKGVNRWGKHYNQASIYRVRVMAEHTIKEVAWKGEQAEIIPVQIIENTTDVVEVVRCKNCNHFAPHPDYCTKLAVDVEEDFYCKYGERRETNA